MEGNSAYFREIGKVVFWSKRILIKPYSPIWPGTQWFVWKKESGRGNHICKSPHAFLLPWCIACFSGLSRLLPERGWREMEEAKCDQQLLCSGHIDLWSKGEGCWTQRLMDSSSFFSHLDLCFKTCCLQRENAPPTIIHADPPFNQNGSVGLLLLNFSQFWKL